jgi:hypothetical protein
MNKKTFLKYGKIVIAIAFAFYFSSFLNKEIFIANSPIVRNDWKEYIAGRINNLNPIVWIKNLGRDKEMAAIREKLKKNIVPVAKGVSAASEGSNSYIEYKLNEVEWAQVVYTLSNGKTVTIKYPKGMLVPPKEIFNK